MEYTCFILENCSESSRSVENVVVRELAGSRREAPGATFSGSDIWKRKPACSLRSCQRSFLSWERGLDGYPPSDSCCAGAMAGLEGERINTPLAVE